MSYGDKRLLTYLYDGAKCVSLETKQITVKLTIKTVSTLTLITTNKAKFIHLNTNRETPIGLRQFRNGADHSEVDYHKNFLLYQLSLITTNIAKLIQRLIRRRMVITAYRCQWLNFNPAHCALRRGRTVGNGRTSWRSRTPLYTTNDFAC